MHFHIVNLYIILKTTLYKFRILVLSIQRTVERYYSSNFKYFCLILIFLSHIAHLFIYITVIYVMNDSRKEYRFNNFERCLLSKFDKKKVTIFLQDNKKYLKSIWLIFSSTMCFTSYWIKNHVLGCLQLHVYFVILRMALLLVSINNWDNPNSEKHLLKLFKKSKVSGY